MSVAAPRAAMLEQVMNPGVLLTLIGLSVGPTSGARSAAVRARIDETRDTPLP